MVTQRGHDVYIVYALIFKRFRKIFTMSCNTEYFRQCLLKAVSKKLVREVITNIFWFLNKIFYIFLIKIHFNLFIIYSLSFSVNILLTGTQL